MTSINTPDKNKTLRKIIPIVTKNDETRKQETIQNLRLLAQIGFFVLFCLAPLFDLLRYDLVAGHAWFLGMPWTAGLQDFSNGQIGALEAAGRVVIRVFLPLLGTAGALIYISWRWGRLYCGWLCPHFSAVETINRLMRKSIRKFSVWDLGPLPPYEPNGKPFDSHPAWWPITIAVAVGFAFSWAVVFLTYLLPPFEVYKNILEGSLSRNQFIFITAATIALTVEFLFARHLFCRYACAVGVFQSLAWMANDKAMVIGYDRKRAIDCSSCDSACDHVCPMRLKPRSIKRKMFTCTQCAQCLDACATTQVGNPQGPLLKWVQDEAAKQNEAGLKSGQYRI